MEDSVGLILTHTPSPLSDASGIFGWPVLWLGIFGIGELVSFLQGIRTLRALTQAYLYLVAITPLAVLSCALSWQSWLPTAPFDRGGVPAAVIGALLAFPVLAADGALARGVHRWLARRPRRTSLAKRTQTRRTVVRSVTKGDTKSPRAAGPSAGRPARGQTALGMAVQVAIGPLEEMVFRGGLLTFAFSLGSGVWTVVFIALGSGMFLLNHYDYGLHQLVAKIPLLVACLALTLAGGSIVGATVLHATFNFAMSRRLRRRGMS